MAKAAVVAVVATTAATVRVARVAMRAVTTAGSLAEAGSQAEATRVCNLCS